MKITNSFEIAMAPDDVYALLLDLEQVAPCLPGAELGEERADGSRAARIAVKLGPMRFTYDGSIRVVEQDDAARRAVLVGEARETRGQGSAEATISMSAAGDHNRSKVSVVADLQLTGRAVQMGGAVVETVARKMIGDMASCLETRFGAAGVSAAAAAESTPAATAPPGGRPSAAAKPAAVGGVVARIVWAKLRGLLGGRGGSGAT